MTRLSIQAGCFLGENHVYYMIGYLKAEIGRIKLTGYRKLIDSDARRVFHFSGKVLCDTCLTMDAAEREGSRRCIRMTDEVRLNGCIFV